MLAVVQERVRKFEFDVPNHTLYCGCFLMSDILSTHVYLCTQEIKKIYRKKSLLVHPDKCKHPKAQEAFDVLKKAQEVRTVNNTSHIHFPHNIKIVIYGQLHGRACTPSLK